MDKYVIITDTTSDLRKEYQEKYDAFYERFCSIEDGNASKRIIDEIRK